MNDHHKRVTVAAMYRAHGFNEVFRNVSMGAGYIAANNIFSRLVTVDVFHDGPIRPDLAESWEVLEDGLVYRFHLREAFWHDGMPVCAEDVRVTYMTAIEQGYRAAASLQDVASIEVRSSQVVDIRLHAPNGGFLYQLGVFVWTHILPAHLYRDTDWGTNPAYRTPIGSGPYRFVREESDGTVVLAANDRHFRGRPKIDELVIHVEQESDPTIAALKAGEVDFSTQDIPCWRYDEMTDSDGVVTAHFAGNALGQLVFNFDRELWRDKRLRQAIALLVDRDQIVNEVCARATPAFNAYLERSWATDGALRYPQRDPRAAQELLALCGFDGSTNRLSLRLVCNRGYPHWEKVAHTVAAQLEEVGIEVDLAAVDSNELSAIRKNRSFDLILANGGIGPDPVLYEEVYLPGSSLNLGNYENPELLDAFGQGKLSIEREKRYEYYRRAQEIILDDLPRISLIQHGNHFAAQGHIAGWSWEPQVNGDLPIWSFERLEFRSGS